MKLKEVFIFSLLLHSYLAQGQEIIIDSKAIDSPEILKGLFIYENLSFPRSFVEMKNQERRRVFKKMSSNFLRIDYSEKTFWLKFTINNTLPYKESLYLHFENSYLDTVEVYQDNKLIYQTGDSFVFSHRPIQTKYFSFKLNLDSAKKSEFYVYLSKRYEVSEVPILLLNESQFFHKEKFDHIFWGIFWGSVITFIFFSVFLYLTTNYSIYLIYSIYLLSAFLFASTLFGFEFLWPNHPIFNAYDVSAFFPFLLGSHLFLMIKFIDFKKSDNRILYYANYIMIFVLYSGGLYQVFLCFLNSKPSSGISYFFMQFAQFLFYLYLFLLFTSITIKILQKSKDALVFLLSMTPITFGLFVSIYGRLAIIKLAFSTIYIQPMCILLEILFLSIALSLKYKRIITEKSLLELTLIEKEKITLQRVLESQDEERKNIAINLHDDMGGILTILQRKINDQLPQSTLKSELLVFTSKATTTLRNLSKKLMPNEIIHGSLVGSLEALVKDFENKEVRIHFIKIGEEKKLKDDIKLNLYRIASELLNNALKHANATDIYLQLNFFTDYLYLAVEDNGANNEHKINISQNSTGLGLKNISLRVGYLGGIFQKSNNENGSVFAIELPYNGK